MSHMLIRFIHWIHFPKPRMNWKTYPLRFNSIPVVIEQIPLAVNLIHVAINPIPVAVNLISVALDLAAVSCPVIKRTGVNHHPVELKIPLAVKRSFPGHSQKGRNSFQVEKGEYGHCHQPWWKRMTFPVWVFHLIHLFGLLQDQSTQWGTNSPGIIIVVILHKIQLIIL